MVGRGLVMRSSLLLGVTLYTGVVGISLTQLSLLCL